MTKGRTMGKGKNKIEYTAEQLKAIEFFDNNLLLSASAGSGKTQVLLEKVIKLIEKGVDLSQILMVTFTNLASSEMKAKLENMLIEKLKVNDANSTKFFNALNKINASDISTLHSFCQKIVREYYYILNIEPNFEILEDSFLFKLKNLALDNTIKFYLDKQDESFVKVSNLFVYKRDYSLFKKELLLFYNFLVSKSNKFEFIENLIKDNYNTNLNENNLFTNFKNFTIKKLENLKQMWAKAKNKADQIGSKTLSDIASSFYGNIVTNFKNNEDFVNFCVLKHDFSRISISKNAEFEEVELKEYFQKELAPKTKDTLKNLNNIFGVENAGDLKLSLKENEKILFKLIEIIKTFEENFKLLKKQNNSLDFNDLETLTLKIFENEEILNEISEKYKFIFVDEYQDTNSVQEEILTRLSKNSKRIMVGDLKQSIYAFRECNPKIFNDKLINYSKDENLGKVILLNKNFRSREAILNFSNLIFSNLMRLENADYSYFNSGKFVAGLKEEKLENFLKPVEVLSIEKPNRKKKGEENETNIEASEEIDKECLLVVNSIYNLLNQKILDGEKEKNLTYKDIAIISRKRSPKIINLCKMLDEFNIPYSVKYKEQIYKSFEVKLILSYLNLLNNLDNDISFFSVLRNIYGFTSNEILTIKTTSILDGIKNYNKNDKIKVKILRFFEDFNSFKSEIGETSVKDLVVKIVKKLKLDIILLKTSGKISGERISKFVENIPSNVFSLSEFLILAKENENREFEIKKTTGQNAVTIDTFHSTKGLEYNAVIIFSAGDEIFSKTTSNLLYNAKFGVGVYNFDLENKIKKPSSIFNMIKELNTLEELNEEVRLAYVAFTRAKNFLIIIGKEKPKNILPSKTPIDFLNFNSYLSMIFSVDFKNVNTFFKEADITKETEINNLNITKKFGASENLKSLTEIVKDFNIQVISEDSEIFVLNNKDGEKLGINSETSLENITDCVQNAENGAENAKNKDNITKNATICDNNIIICAGNTNNLNQCAGESSSTVKDGEISKTIVNGEEKLNLNEISKYENLGVDLSVFEFIKSKKYDFEGSTMLALKNSVTMLSEEDKQIYNISNFKITDTDTEDYIELGNAYHEALEKLPFGLKSEKEVRNKMLELIELNLISPNIYDYVEDKKLFNAIKSIKTLVCENDKIYKEHTFMMYVPYNKILGKNINDKILVQGIIDLFIEKEDEIILIDYKTSRLNDINLIKKYDMQLSLYALALKEKFKNKKISKFIYSIFLEKLINIV